MAREEGDSAEKTKKPTRRRLRRAREQGEVAKSKDLTGAVALTAWVVAFGLAAPVFIRIWERRADAVIAAAVTPTAETLEQNLWSSLTLISVGVLTLLGTIALIGLLAQFIQIGPVFAPNKVSLDFSHLNPANWAKRFTKWETLVELLKGVLTQVLVLTVGYAVAKSLLAPILSLPQAQPTAILPVFAMALQRLFGITAAIGLGLGLLDLLYQRFVFMKDMRMSVSEFKRDHRQMEGDPKIKGRRKKLYRDWANHNASEATRRAAVVVTNPTHYAVALAYDPTEHLAPVVAAKGQDELAAEIRRAAEDADIPIIRNPPLARELHDRIDIEEAVPEDLFMVIAEVIVWANRLRKMPEVVDSHV